MSSRKNQTPRSTHVLAIQQKLQTQKRKTTFSWRQWKALRVLGALVARKSCRADPLAIQIRNLGFRRGIEAVFSRSKKTSRRPSLHQPVSPRGRSSYSRVWLHPRAARCLPGCGPVFSLSLPQSILAASKWIKSLPETDGRANRGEEKRDWRGAFGSNWLVHPPRLHLNLLSPWKSLAWAVDRVYFFTAVTNCELKTLATQCLAHRV